MLVLAIATTLVVGYLVTQTAGYAIHRAMHKKRMGRVYQAHLEHHVRYSTDDYLSDSYRDVSLRNKPVLYYAIPAGITIGLAFWLIPPLLAMIFAAELLLVAWMNDWLHSCFHQRGHWLERFTWFQRLRDLHWMHHKEEETNFGIFDFHTDRLASTYEGAFIPDYPR